MNVILCIDRSRKFMLKEKIILLNLALVKLYMDYSVQLRKRLTDKLENKHTGE